MINYKKISIVLATYNGETYLEEQLNSLINQTYPNLEIIAVDDCSTDGTLAILNRYAQQNPHFTVYLNDTNLGFIKNFEKGCSLATGELIALCDQDDVWDKDKLTLMAEAMGEHAMVYCDSWLCDGALKKTGKKISDVAVCKSFTNCLECAVFVRIYGHTTLFTKKLFEQCNLFLPVIPHDWWLAYNASLYGGIYYLNQPLVYYRQHDNNLFGVIGRKRTDKNAAVALPDANIKRQRSQYTELEKIRIRIQRFYDVCPGTLVKEKKVLLTLLKSYQSFSLVNNFVRMVTFFRYQKLLLAIKKYSLLRRYMFCLKMFIKLK
jgi:glycosyltransferase involved in cell wall biosynthesis